MSSEKGNVERKRPPKHQNSFGFRHNKNSMKSRKIASLPNDGLCQRCHQVIEWKKKFRKYKPLSVPGKCFQCENKTVTRAYHRICDPCAIKLQVCAKCREQKSLVTELETTEERKMADRKLREKLEAMSERKRRTYFRKLENGEQPSLDSDDSAGEENQNKNKNNPENKATNLNNNAPNSNDVSGDSMDDEDIDSTKDTTQQSNPEKSQTNSTKAKEASDDSNNSEEDDWKLDE